MKSKPGVIESSTSVEVGIMTERSFSGCKQLPETFVGIRSLRLIRPMPEARRGTVKEKYSIMEHCMIPVSGNEAGSVFTWTRGTLG